MYVKGFFHPCPCAWYAHIPPKKRWRYHPRDIQWRDLTLVYSADHDVRHAHVPPEERWKYPDKIQAALPGSGRYSGEYVYHPDHDLRHAHIPPKERWRYPDEVRRWPFRLIYAPAHETRYAHISSEERWEYPDEVVKVNGFLGFGVRYAREKTYDEIVARGGLDTRQYGFVSFQMLRIDLTDLLLLSKDKPIHEAIESIHYYR